MGGDRQSMGPHKVYLHFMLRQAWHCQFLEAELQTPLQRKLTFADSDRIVALAERGGALKDLAARQALAYGVELGRGSVWLYLSNEQYLSLTRPATRR
jgi:hypothetical protein